jgi:hypothetical protein
MKKQEPIFKIGDLVESNTSFEVTWSGFGAAMVVGVRSDTSGPFAVYTLLKGDGSTTERYEFELAPVGSGQAHDDTMTLLLNP